MTGTALARMAVSYPKTVSVTTVAVTVCLLLLAALPSLMPDRFPVLNALKVDTDPENMLPASEPVRVFHNEKKREMALHDMVVVGVVNRNHPEGVFNPETLQRVHELTAFAKTLRWPDPRHPEKKIGVIEPDIIAPSTVDNIEQAGPGTVRFEWLMPKPPETQAEAEEVRRRASRISMLNGTLVSEDGKALCLYLPITAKDQSYRIYSRLKEKIASFDGDDEFHITGLPVANDTFGVEMFVQMAVSAPLAMLIIFLTLLFFFRKLVLILSPLILAVIATIWTMALLIITGNTIHIMSSMIPIFIMPIAVLDSVHILSEFFDRYQQTRDRRKTISAVMDDLFLPMLYTSLTTAVGFASLALAPIPPVQVFGLFVALGVLAAWLLTILFIPAYIMFIPEQRLAGFGLKAHETRSSVLAVIGRFTAQHAPAVLVVSGLLAACAAYGITRISINDNPVKWFTRSHPIRVADTVLNSHFGGTYMAYLALDATQEESSAAAATRLQKELERHAGALHEDVADAVNKKAVQLKSGEKTAEQFFDELAGFARTAAEKSPPEQYAAWEDVQLVLDRERRSAELFKQPAVLAWLDGLQQHLLKTGVVGKSNALTDIVKTVYRELVSGRDEDFRIPGSAAAVGQCLITYQNSHRPYDLWHFATPDYRSASVWVQLTSGDNRDMTGVVAAVDAYIETTPPPVPLEHRWFGLTYINVIWQKKMVKGMLEAFLGSFLIVFLMMTLLYRSGLWGLLSMIPLSVTILLIYGITGFVGKDYDMPIAVLSSLSLGLAVDYAIHFLSRTRAIFSGKGSWAETVPVLFGEPARAISRNVVVLGVGFIPLLFAPLMPYKTVGVFIATILLLAGIATLFMLPALISVLQRLVFPQTASLQFTCKCGTCIASGIAVTALVLINLIQFTRFGWTAVTGIGIAGIAVLAAVCMLLSRRRSCTADSREYQ